MRKKIDELFNKIAVTEDAKEIDELVNEFENLAQEMAENEDVADISVDLQETVDYFRRRDITRAEFLSDVESLCYEIKEREECKKKEQKILENSRLREDLGRLGIEVLNVGGDIAEVVYENVSKVTHNPATEKAVSVTKETLNKLDNGLRNAVKGWLFKNDNIKEESHATDNDEEE